MARTSNAMRDQKRQNLRQQYAAKRERLLKIMRDPEANPDDRWDAQVKFQKYVPRNANPTREKNRCNMCGRPRGYHRYFGLCRMCLRKYARQGLIAGVTKSSW